MPTLAPIAVTLFRRPDYTRRVLEALDRCYGVNDRRIYLSVDSNDNFAAEIAQVGSIASEWVSRHSNAELMAQGSSDPLGIDVHKEMLITYLLKMGHDRFIFLEDDIVPARDALRFFDWALDAFQYDPRIMSVCGYAKTADLPIERLYTAHAEVNFCPWGWAMWADRWTTHWRDGRPYRRELPLFGDNDPNGHFDAWWLELCRVIPQQTIFPDVARTQNIGRENGVHTRPETFEATDYNPIGAWLVEALPDYRGWSLEAQP